MTHYADTNSLKNFRSKEVHLCQCKFSVIFSISRWQSTKMPLKLPYLYSAIFYLKIFVIIILFFYILLYPLKAYLEGKNL